LATNWRAVMEIGHNLTVW